MKKYQVGIKFIAPYLQARFGEEAQASLKVKAGSKAKVEDDDSWKKLIYRDEDLGIYIPGMQIKGSLVNGGKAIKKKPFGSFKDLVKAYFFVEEEKIYLHKQEPDFIKVSYPPRKDGMRVRLAHPAFNAGMEVEFTLNVTNEEIDAKTIQMILEKAGMENGAGAWRPENGRYEVIKFEAI